MRTTLLWAYSFPAREQRFPPLVQDVFYAIGETLIDLDACYYTSDRALENKLARLGGSADSPELAIYQFYPVVNDQALVSLRRACAGALLASEESVSLFLGCDLNNGPWVEIEGPGLPGKHRKQTGGIPAEFWKLREEICVFPRGWDIFLVSDGCVLALPGNLRVRVLADE
jgi:alpha-D-ribose 1-methylphosphonate 5-triphosphate synthase subunit PhnH